MHPILIDIGGFPITTYGLMVAIAFLTFWWVTVRRGKRLGYDPEFIQNLLTLIVISAMVGARLLHVVVSFDEYRQNPWKIFSREGYVFLGGFLAAVVVSAWYIRKHKQSVLGVADLFAPYLPLAHSIGRVGCFLYGCCWGGVCNAPWAVRFPENSPSWIDQYNNGLIPANQPWSLPVHPTQLYESFFLLGLFFFLRWLRGRQTFKGQLAMTYLIAYGVGRSIIEHFRVDPRGFIAGLSTSQWIGLLMTALGVWGYWILRNKAFPPERPVASPSE
ncbi:MAG: prolipoprotein diacylglyceryl transferase [bacterium]|nr:prolipoprotein diacylglyceryl transferase [bacterium]